MQMTIKSRSTGREYHFVCCDNGGYVRVSTGGDYKQICRGGGFFGSTLSASSEREFASVCRRWYRAMMKSEK